MSAGALATAEVWRRCLDWLIRLKVLKEDDPLTKPSSSIIDLAKRLQDGVLLCRILRTIKEELVEAENVSFVKNQRSKLIWTLNIKLFKEICEKKFGLPRQKLFHTSDLIEFENLESVLLTLSLLSNTEEAAALATPFSFTKEEYAINLTDDFTEGSEEDLDDDYENYYFEPWRKNHREETTTTELDHEETYQNTIRSLEYQDQLPYVPFDLIDPSPATVHHYTLIQSEKYYAETLIVCNSIVEPRLLPVLGVQQCKRIFYKFAVLKELHIELYHDLSKTFPYNLEHIHEIFFSHRNAFLEYLDYSAKFKVSCQIYREAQAKSEQTAEEIRKIEEEHGSILNYFLVMPFERLREYIRMLQKLHTHCKTESKDSEAHSVCNALKMLIKMADLAGEAISDEEFKNYFNEKVFYNFHKIPGGIGNFRACGRLILDDRLSFTSKSNFLRRSHEGYIFIFEEAMVLMRSVDNSFRYIVEWLQGISKKKNFEYFRTFYSQEMFPQLVSNIGGVSSPDTKAKGPVRFSLDKEVGPQTLYFVPHSLRRSQHIQKAIVNARIISSFKSQSSHKFLMHSLSIETIKENAFCDICNNYFKGTYCQCYVCSSCSLKCHTYCSVVGEDIKCSPEFSSKENLTMKDSWWKGKMNRREAVNLMNIYNFDDGLFFIRWSHSQVSNVLSVCDRNKDVQHILLEWKNGFSFTKGDRNQKTFLTLKDLVHFYIENDISEAVSSINAKLKFCPTSFNDKDFTSYCT